MSKLDANGQQIEAGLTDPWSHEDGDLILAQGQINEIIRAIRRFKVLELPITVNMANEVAEAILDSKFACTIQMGFEDADAS